MYIRQLFVRFFLIGCSFFCVLCCFGLGLAYYVAQHHCIDFSALEYYSPGRPSVVLDVHGNEWTRFQLDRREPISLQHMPQHLINAFVATEDWAFFRHAGLSWKGIVRSIVFNIYYGRKVQGASTITQQLVRLLFFDARKTFSRKLKEQVYALLVEQQFTKEQILEAYLNHVYFGCGIYGVEAASQRFWGKSAAQLTIDEAALLAGIVRSPGNYCPLLYPLSAQKRRNVVLGLMHKLHFISEQEKEQARSVSVVVVDKDLACCAPHAREWVRQQLEDIVGKKLLYTGGLVIQSTLDFSMQQRAHEQFCYNCEKLRAKLAPDVDGALLSIDVSTGEIRALVGGYDYTTSKFNRAVQARRQMGSIFKPILYAQALMSGISFADVDVDEPFTMNMPNGQTWSPKNYDGRYTGAMTLARSLSYSNNIIAIKTLLKVGAERIASLARACHLDSVPGPYPSLALGCIDATLKETTAMFNIIANRGVYVEPHILRWVKDGFGNKIWRHTPLQERVIPIDVADRVAKVMMIGLKRLKHKAWRGPWLNSQGICKTGTTNDSRTCSFAGSTPSTTTVVYIGCDDNRSLGRDVYPSRTAFPIWIGLHHQIPSFPTTFSFDPRLKEIVIDGRTGEVADPDDEDAITIFE